MAQVDVFKWMRSASIRTPEVRGNGVIVSWNPVRYQLSSGPSKRLVQPGARNLPELLTVSVCYIRQRHARLL